MFGKRRSEAPSLLERAAETVRKVIEAAPAQEPPTPAGRPSPATGVLLAPGPHIIDGQLVDVPHEGTREHVWYPLAPGKYVIDERIAIVHAPGQFSAI